MSFLEKLKNINLSSLSKDKILLLKTPLVVTFCMVLILVVGLSFFVKPKKDRYMSLERRYVKMQKRINDIQRETKKHQPQANYQSQLLLSDKEETEDYVNYINKRFIIDPYQQDISYKTINFKHNVRVPLKEKKIVGSVFYIKSQLNIQVQGSFSGITRYLTHIQELPVMFNYEKIHMTNTNQNPHNILMNLTLNFYFIQ